MLERSRRAAGRRHRLRRRRLERHRHVPSVHRRRVGGDHRHRSRRHGHGARRRTPPRSPTAGPACCRARTRCCCRTRTARSRKRIRSPRASTIPASGPSTRCCCGRAACATKPRPTTNRSTALDRVLPHRRHPAGDRIRACARRREALGESESGQANPHRPLRPRRQGHADAAAHRCWRSTDNDAQRTNQRRDPRRQPGGDRPSSRSSPPAFRSARNSASISRRSATRPTWSRSACRSPIRWPTA